MPRIHLAALIAVVVLAFAVLGRPTAGGPILPSEKKTEDVVLCLAKVRQVEIVVAHLAPQLRAAGLSEEDIKARWTKRLTEEHFEVADGKGYSKLLLRNVTTLDQDVPNAVAYAFVSRFEQAVRVERLNQTLFLPTYSETLLRLETNAHLGHAAMVNVNRAIELFIAAVKKADAAKTE